MEKVFTVLVASAMALGTSLAATRPENDAIVRLTCSDATSETISIFSNPLYPSEDFDTGLCTFVINHTPEICQLRLDFLDFELSQPTSEGYCVSDSFRVEGYHTQVPSVCGSNSGQHMYVEMEASAVFVSLTVDRLEDLTPRRWNIQVTQIPCTSLDRAPSGCLQYHTAVSGTISSFNFDQAPATIPGGTRELQDMNYGVCVGVIPGYCGVQWTRQTSGGDYGFSLTGNVDILAPELLGTPNASNTGDACTTDYVIIPGGIDENEEVADRYCGLGFPNTVTTTSGPFVLYVKTDKSESLDQSNHGFSLEYHQLSVC